MITTLFIVYRAIVAILAVVVVLQIIREKSLANAICLGMVCLPLIMRALMIK